MWHDLQFGFRNLRKNPGFTFVAILTLALGIGANTAIFSIVNAILLRPLPFHEPGNLVGLNNSFPAIGLRTASTSVADFYDYRRQKHIFEEVATISGTSFNLTGVDRPERLPGAQVSASLFPMLGLKPVTGRFFTEEEDQPGHDRVVVLDEGLWRRLFGADPNILGRPLRLNDESYEVIGVIPPALAFVSKIELWTPTAFTEEQKSPRRRGNQFLSTFARLKEGVSLEQARTEMAAFAKTLQKEFPDNYPESSGWHIRIERLSELLVGDMRLALVVLFGSVGFVLLIACANVANLMLARATSRAREISIRSALGAGRWRIVRQLLTESTLLGLFGGAGGLLLGSLGIELLLKAAPENIPRLQEVDVDPTVLVFTFAVSILTGLVFGLAPAFKIARSDVHDTLKEGARAASGGLGRHRTRSVLVVAEVSLSLVLLVGAGLLMQSLRRLQRVDTGFRAQNVLTFRVALPVARYINQEQTAAFFQRLLDQVRSMPGVDSVGASHSIPFSGSNSSGSFTIEGRETPPGGTGPHADVRTVSPDYFQAMGIPLRRGRIFAESENAKAPLLALVDEKLAAQYWPNEDAIGKRVRRGGNQAPWFTIAGIVGHVKHQKLDSESKGVLYTSHLQNRAQGMAVVVRTKGDPRSLASSVQSAVAAVDKDLPIYEVKTMERRLTESLAPQRLAMYLLAVFSGIALLLAAIGIYGVMSQSVTQRTHEIGIRMALGAGQGSVLRMIVGHGLVLTAAGLLTGIAGSLALTRLIEKLLFGVKATDPATFGAVTAVLAVVATLASYLPARRATRVDPLIALRYE